MDGSEPSRQGATLYNTNNPSDCNGFAPFTCGCRDTTNTCTRDSLVSMILRCIDQHLYELRCGMFSAVHLPKSHFRGRRHRFLSGLGTLRSTYKGRSTSCPVGFHRTQETLRLCGCSGLLSKFLEELCLVYLSLSP